jgi:hypothetical protein
LKGYGLDVAVTPRRRAEDPRHPRRSGVNAAFNAQLARKRAEAAKALVLRFLNGQLGVQRKMLELANVEVQDALDVLRGQAGLNADARAALAGARELLAEAEGTGSAFTRPAASWRQSRREPAVDGIGANLSLDIGTGTVMF